MKAQILKIAGVKTEAEFYKKFPSEEAFMKKHGKELKKAQYGTYVAGQPEKAEQEPIMYDDLQQDMMARITGVSKKEKARQEGLAATAGSKSSGGDGLAGLLGMAGQMLAPQVDKLMGVEGAGSADGAEMDIMSSIAGSLLKNGKKLKKAATGFEGIIKPPAMPKIEQVNLAKTKGFGLNKLQDIPASTDRSFDYAGAAKKIPGALASQLGTLIGSYQQIEQNQKDITKANQWADISQISSQAALSRPEQSKRRYARPEDNLVTGMNPLGKKDSLLAAENGAEIANTFAPNDIYTDLGYEPLNDSNLKQYAHGGYLPKAVAGMNLNSFAGIGGDVGGILGSKIGGGSGKGGPGSAIGSAFGGALGTLIPIPGVGSFLGSLAGGTIGGLFDSGQQNDLQEAQDRQALAINKATIGKGASNLQQANKAFMENGGYMNPEYNPQVIAKFGEYDVDQLFVPPHDADMLRAGGHLKEYTPPSAEAMYTGRDLPYQMEYGGQMAMGGDLQVHRGQAETLSYNPFLPDGGETIMFRGPSHDNGGMPISFGQNGVEVEGGEPAVKLQDGGSPDGNLVVYGNMIIPEYGVAELGDENAKGKKFKHYVDDLSKIEAKQNKLVDKTTQLINNADANDQFDKLTLNTGEANLIGTTMKLKEIAEKKKTAAAVQNAILDTASEMGLESDALAKGKIKYAKANDPYAEFGAKLEEFAKGGKKGKKAKATTVITTPSKDVSSLQGFVKNIPYNERKAMAESVGITDFKGTPEQNDFLLKKTQYSTVPTLAPKSKFDINIPSVTKAMDKSIASGVYKTKTDDVASTEDDTNWWETGIAALASAAPQLRPSNQVALDPSQLSGELYSLSQNQEEPVFAQSYQPMLSQPISISLQDQINEITAQANASKRLAQNNPALLPMIDAQLKKSIGEVLGEQFRMNQGEAQRVGETNRQTMNEAQKMNLGLYDQQQQRQAQAKSNTKMQNITALNSINDKIMKNKLENKQLAISENLYNYRFGPNGVAYNLNSPVSFAPYGSGSGGSSKVPEGMTPIWESDDSGKPQLAGYKKKKEDKSTSRNGSIVKAIKGL